MGTGKKVGIVAAVGCGLFMLGGVAAVLCLVGGEVFDDLVDAFSPSSRCVVTVQGPAGARPLAPAPGADQAAPAADPPAAPAVAQAAQAPAARPAQPAPAGARPRPAPPAKIVKNPARAVSLRPFANAMFSMQVPQGWVVGAGNSDHAHYTFMAYDPKKPDYKIFFNMKTEGYFKTPAMKNFYAKNYGSSPLARLPVLAPQTTDAFYRVFTQAFALDQGKLPFRVPVINDFAPVQRLGNNATGGAIVRAVYRGERGQAVEGVFTATIKEVAIPPVVFLVVYNAAFFTAPEGELLEWMPVLNRCLGSIKFTPDFVSGYYREQGQVARNAQALQAICGQISDIVASGWNARQKTYDILSQKRSDATMGWERVRDVETGEIYKATIGFSDTPVGRDRYEPITGDMYLLPTAGYIEKKGN